MKISIVTLTCCLFTGSVFSQESDPVEPCSPRLLPMTTTRLPYVESDGTETNAIEVNSQANTDTRALMVTYICPAKSEVGEFSVAGTAQIENTSNAQRNVKYRMSTRIDEGFVPIFEQDSDLCWDATKRRIVSDYVYTVAAGETITRSITWGCTIRREDQIADINADGVINAQDQGLLLADFGSDLKRSDLNFDGIVNGKDLGILFGQWSDTFSPGGN